MPMTYTGRIPDKNSSCHECGALAFILLIADYPDKDGYVDEIALCAEHFNLTENCVTQQEFIDKWVVK